MVSSPMMPGASPAGAGTFVDLIWPWPSQPVPTSRFFRSGFGPPSVPMSRQPVPSPSQVTLNTPQGPGLFENSTTNTKHSFGDNWKDLLLLQEQWCRRHPTHTIKHNCITTNSTYNNNNNISNNSNISNRVKICLQRSSSRCRSTSSLFRRGSTTWRWLTRVGCHSPSKVWRHFLLHAPESLIYCR